MSELDERKDIENGSPSGAPDNMPPPPDGAADAGEKKRLYHVEEKELSDDELRAAGSRRGGPGGGGPGPRGGVIREKPKDAKGTIFKIIRYIGKNAGLVLILVVIMLATTGTSLASPAIQGAIIDCITVDETNFGLAIDFDSLIFYLALMAGIYVINCLLTLVQSLTSTRLSQWTVYNLRRDLFEKIEYLPIRYTDTHKHGDIMSRMTNDVESVSNAISQSLTSLISSVLTLIGSFAMIIYYCVKGDAIPLICSPDVRC